MSWIYTANFLDHQTEVRAFLELQQDVAWRDDTITLFGRECSVPRQHQFHGDTGLVYKFSGIEMAAQPWLPILEQIRFQLSAYLGERFNGVLLNHYRTGEDYVSWHSDDEEEIDPNSSIVCVSLGSARDFKLRRKVEKSDVHSLILAPGSLFCIPGGMQTEWEHTVPKRCRCRGSRISLTFRRFS